ncbi:MAG: HAMP domain-containing histidine kinase, partial [Alphaproteobacteria bacterium]|nr:HAMP domain-containing histidine kinase [Alphaproteobacteria bacterium]
DADGKVAAYIGEPGMVRQHQVALEPVRRFLAGETLPILGTDPMDSGMERIFSAAMFPPLAGAGRPPGYLYVVLDSRDRERVADETSRHRLWQGAAAAAAAGLAITLLLGGFAVRRITRPLQSLAERMNSHRLERCAASPRSVGRIDEVGALDAAFDAMTRRLAAQAAEAARQASVHREIIAGVAHDLRTPLTALHGQLEALAEDGSTRGTPRAASLGAALKQSERVRRLSQQLFELAALQTSAQVPHRERFRLDELVTDAVRKFDRPGRVATVSLDGPAPGRIEVSGDPQLVERALDNLIDNALRHAGSAAPVRVSLAREVDEAWIVVADAGSGLPADLQERLTEGAALSDRPARRARGGIGGIGLAIVQRVAALHGGRLQPLPAPEGGSRLCLALPID